LRPTKGLSVVLAHMFGDHTEEEPEGPVFIVEGRIADRFLQ